MAEAGRDLTGMLAGDGAAESTGRWTRDMIIQRIRSEADRQKVDPDLAVAVATQESSLRPDNPGDNGASRGVFHLQRKAAIDAGIDPRWRDDPGVGIYAGVRYLKQKLDQSGGNVEQALSRYNRGTPDYRGIGDPDYVYHVMRHYPGHPLGKAPADQDAYRARLNKTFGAGTAPEEPRQPGGMMARVSRALSPASAEAATSGGRDLTAASSQGSSAGGGRDFTDLLLGAQQPPQAPTSPQTPAPVSQTAPTPQTPPRPQETPQTPDTSWTPGMRFQALPSIQQLPPEERIRYQQEFEALSPALQAEFLSSEAPADLPGAPTAPGPRAAPASAAPAPASSTRIEPLTEGGVERVLADRPHEAGIPLQAVPAIAINTLGTVGGAALGAPLGPVGSAAGAALGGSLATRASTALGLAGQEKPLLETPWANVYPSDLLGALPLGIAGSTAALKGTVRNLPGANVGRHELAAETLEQLGQRVGPARPSSELFTEAAAQGGAVPMPTLWKAAGKVVREEKGMEKGFVSTEAMQAGSGLLNLMRKHGGQVPLDEVEKYRQRLFQKIKTTTDRAELQRLQDLYGAIHDDLALAATSGTAAGAGTLKAAIAAKRKEHAQETLTDVWSPGKGLQLQEGNHTQIYGKRIRNEVEKRLHKDKLFAGSFTAAETVDIRNTLREVGKLTRMTNPDAQGAVGSTLKWLGRLGGAGGAGYGVATGDLTTMLTGGSMLLATEGATAVLTSAMQSKMGRWALREAIREGNGTMTHGSLAAIAALVAREAAPDAPVSEHKP